MVKKMDKKDFKNFVEASYKNKRDAANVNGYELDKELSTKRDKVYVDSQGNVIHTIAGTDSMKDWSNNALIPLGLHTKTNRYKNSERIQREANKKYGKENVSLVSHSQSGNIAENLANKGLVGGLNTTLNPAIIGKHNKNLSVIKSEYDPVSLFTKTNKHDDILKATSYNPLTEHSTAILGSGINLKKTKQYINNMNPSKYNESELIDRMAKLSHDIHVHKKVHGNKKNLVKAYELVGKGIIETMSGCGQKGSDSGNNNVDKFNDWFKAIGNKFKPLNKNLSPIKHAGTDATVKYIEENSMTPEDRFQQGLDMYQREAPETAETFKGKKGNKGKKGSKPPSRPPAPDYSDYYQPRTPQPRTPYHYEEYYEPEEPEYYEPEEPIYAADVTNYNSAMNDMNSRNAFNSQPSSYDRSFNSKYGRGVNSSDTLKQGLTQNAVDLTNAATARAIKGIQGGRIRGRAVNSSDVLKQGLTQNAVDLVNAATARAIKGISGGTVNSSDVLKKSLTQNALDMVDAATARAIKGISGSGMNSSDMLKQGLTQNAVDLVNAATARAIKGISGGRIRGRGYKDTPEAKANEAAEEERWRASQAQQNERIQRQQAEKAEGQRQYQAKTQRNVAKDKKQDKAVKDAGPLFDRMVYDSQNRDKRHKNNPGLYDPHPTYSNTQYYGNGVIDSFDYYGNDAVEDRKNKRENDKYGALKGKGVIDSDVEAYRLIQEDELRQQAKLKRKHDKEKKQKNPLGLGLKKGSPEMKAKMARIRAMRGK